MIALHEDEKVVLERRRHWLPITMQAIAMGFFAILPCLAFLFLDILPGPARDMIRLFTTEFFFLASVWTLFAWVIFFIAWTNYYLNVLIVTNKRVIDVDQTGLFARELSELRYENIQDISVEVKGLIPSLLKFGTLSIQTAGEREEFIAKNIPDPNGVREAISAQHDEIQQKIVERTPR